jgi:hypothetical protein
VEEGDIDKASLHGSKMVAAAPSFISIEPVPKSRKKTIKTALFGSL